MPPWPLLLGSVMLKKPHSPNHLILCEFEPIGDDFWLLGEVGLRGLTVAVNQSLDQGLHFRGDLLTLFHQPVKQMC